MEYKQVRFENISAEKKEILIALLSDADFEGFEEEGDGDGLLAYIPATKFDEVVLKNIASSQSTGYHVTAIAQKNWNQVWESNFEPVVIKNFVAVRAEFHPPAEQVQHEIVITPKMSFGTGHHATTAMMLEAMEKIDFKEKSVLDFGTGTGILAILAEKLGAKTVTGIDNDEWSIENARENALGNHCEHVQVQLGSTSDIGGHFDVILANIIRQVIMENFKGFAKQLNVSGQILLSGLLVGDEEMIREMAVAQGFSILSKYHQGNWISLLLGKISR